MGLRYTKLLGWDENPSARSASSNTHASSPVRLNEAGLPAEYPGRESGTRTIV